MSYPLSFIRVEVPTVRLYDLSDDLKKIEAQVSEFAEKRYPRPGVVSVEVTIPTDHIEHLPDYVKRASK